MIFTLEKYLEKHRSQEVIDQRIAAENQTE
jgi:hypothetical protein